VLAQAPSPDSSFYTSATQNTLNIYAQGIGNQSRLINGHEYLYYDRLLKGDAYYGGYEWRPGKIDYDGVYYHDVPFLYDVYQDLVVLQLPDKAGNYSLINEKLPQFILMGHTFIKIKADSTNKLKTGFYDLLYSGKVQALAKTVKTIQNTGSYGTIEKSFIEEKSYYIKNKGIYYEVGGEGDVLKALKDKKKEMQQYIKSEKIKYRKDPDQFLIKITSYYDHLTNTI